MVREEKISFVVQGSISDLVTTKKCIKSIRANFSKSIIILSTWHSEELKARELDFDHLVLNEDPGAITCNDVKNTPFNINRQIVSSRGGIEIVQTDYVVKTRTDSYFKNRSIVNQYNFLSRKYSSSESIDKVLVISDWFLNPRGRLNLPCHISDFLYFGRKDDVLNFFPTKLIPNNEIRWYKNKNYPDCYPELLHGFLMKYAAEQIFFINFLKKRGEKFSLNSMATCDEAVFKECEAFIRKYLIVLPSLDIGLVNQKHKYMYHGNIPFCYTKSEVKRIYKNEDVGFSTYNIERCVSKPLLIFKKVLDRLVKNQ